MLERAFVLLSGGIDSTVCLYLASKEFEGSVEAVSLDYGQRHAREIDYAQRSCQALSCKHTVKDISGLLPSSLLTDLDGKLPDASYDDLPTGVSPTYVPFRNAMLLSSITAIAQGHVMNTVGRLSLTFTRDLIAIYWGAHAEDARHWAYPDCTPEFAGAMANAISVGTYYTCRLRTPLQWLDKAGIIRLGEELGVDWRNTWSCYVGEMVHCGRCPTCRSRRAGFERAGVADPTEYAA